MDNITHTLIGVLASEIAQTQIPPDATPFPRASRPSFRKAILLASVFGNNFPDLDFLLTPFTGAGRLGNIVHHRGFTHTLLFSVFAGFVCAWAARKLSGHSKTQSKKEVTAIVFMGIIGNFLHIFADFWNDYGVHPFWPFVNRWFYGDFIFIIEPLIWIALIPLAIRAAFSKIGKSAWIFIASIMGLFLTFTNQLALPIKCVLLTWALVQYAVHRTPNVRPFAALASLVLVLSTFAFASLGVSQTVRATIQKIEGETPLDTILSPAPSNPLCWRLIAVSLDAKGDLVSRVGGISLWPDAFSALNCQVRKMSPTERTAPLSSTQSLTTASHYPASLWGQNLQIDLIGERRLGLAQYLEAIKPPRCGLSGYLAWSRAPFWLDPTETKTASLNSNEVLAGDIRYDFDVSPSFAELPLHAGVCSRIPIPWEPPLFTFLKKSGKIDP